MIVELIPKGWLDGCQTSRLRRDIFIALNRDCAAILISGEELRYRNVDGLAAFCALLAEAQAHSPRIPIWLCHISPDLRAAATLAAVDQHWNLAPDRATALDSINAHIRWPALPAVPASRWEATHGRDEH